MNDKIKTYSMKTIQSTMRIWALSLLFLAFLPACDRVELPEVDSEETHSCVMYLNGGVQGFGNGTKAAGSFTFSGSNRIYVRLEMGSKVILGMATYDEGTASWTFTYNGSLSGAEKGTAKAYLFEKTFTPQAFWVECSYKTPIYEDLKATFEVTDAAVTLSANLVPMTGRISLVHDLDEGYGRSVDQLSGISYYKRFSLTDFTFETSSNTITDWFSRGGDEYIYGFFTNASDPSLCYYNGDYYYQHFPTTVFQKGQSGYVNHPNYSSTGWTRYNGGRDFYLSGINGSAYKYLRVNYVPAGSFLMGSTEDEDSQPVHSVTLSHYYIGRYEVSQGEWYNVMGEPSDWANSVAPANWRSYEEIQEFITKLNEKTGYLFRLPTEAEWEFAARGGIYSHGYRFSGSDTYSDVGNPDDYAIGTKNANELGLYDMTGDVAELCSDWYGPYSDQAVTNPTGPATGTARVVRGGARWEGETPVWRRASTDNDNYSSWSGYWDGDGNYYEQRVPKNDRLGFRLVMEVPPFAE